MDQSAYSTYSVHRVWEVHPGGPWLGWRRGLRCGWLLPWGHWPADRLQCSIWAGIHAEDGQLGTAEKVMVSHLKKWHWCLMSDPFSLIALKVHVLVPTALLTRNIPPKGRYEVCGWILSYQCSGSQARSIHRWWLRSLQVHFSAFPWVFFFFLPLLFQKDSFWSLLPFPDDLLGPLNYYRSSLRYKPDRRAKDQVDIRTLVIWGTGDVALAKDLPELSKKYFTDLTIHYIEGGSHWIQNDEPEKVNQFIREFLSGKKSEWACATWILVLNDIL